MREYADDNIRRYAWGLQRMVIVAAVIIAVPVMMWTISTFIRSYVGRPMIPAFQHLTLTEPTQSLPPASPLAASIPPAPHTARPAPAHPLADTVTTDNDADALKGPLLGPPGGDASPGPDTPLRGAIGSPLPIPSTAPAAAPPDTAAPPAAAPTEGVTPTNGGFAWPDPKTDSPRFGAPSQPLTIAETAAAEPLPAPEPIKGRIPLPRHRPSAKAMTATANVATTGSIVPLPRVRPTGAPVGDVP